MDDTGVGKVEVGAGAKSDHADMFALPDMFRGLFPGHNPACDQAGNLPDKHGTAGRSKQPGLVFVAKIHFQMPGIEKFPGRVMGFFHHGVARAPVDVDIEDGKKNSHAAELAQAKAGILRLVHTDDLTIGGTDQSEGIGGNLATRIPKKEEEAHQQEGGQGGGNPPTQPETGAEENGDTD